MQILLNSFDIYTKRQHPTPQSLMLQVYILAMYVNIHYICITALT